MFQTKLHSKPLLHFFTTDLCACDVVNPLPEKGKGSLFIFTQIITEFTSFLKMVGSSL